MNTKKWIALSLFVLTLIVALAAGYLVARQELGENPIFVQATPSPTPEPTPTPKPPLVALAVPENDTLLCNAVEALPGIDVVEAALSSVADMTDIDAAVVYVGSSADAEAVEQMHAAGIAQIVAYNRCGAKLPDEVIEIGYAVTAPQTAEEAMEIALTYPPHDSPVRLLGVFTSADSEAAQAWDTAIQAGKVLSKGAYGLAEEEKDTLEDWFADRLAALYPGMVDAAFVETPFVAAALAEKMIEAERDDFEIFTIGMDAALLELTMANTRLLPSSVKVDDAAAAEACAKALSQLISGAAPQDVVLEPAA